MGKTKKLVSLIVSSLMITMWSAGIFANVSPQSTSYQSGNTVTITGTTSLSDINLKIVNEANGSVVYFDEPTITNNQYSVSFTLGDKFLPGKYKVMAGSGSNIESSEFTVYAPTPITPGNSTSTPTSTPTPTPTASTENDPVAAAVYSLPDKPTAQDGTKALDGLADKGLSAADSQRAIEGIFNKLQSLDVAAIGAAANLINNSNKVAVTGNTISDKALADAVASFIAASKYADSLKEKFGEKAVSEFKDVLALNIVANDKDSNGAEVLIDAENAKKLGNAGVDLQVTTSILSAVVPSDLLQSSALDGAKYIKFTSAISEAKDSKTLLDKAKALDPALEAVGKVNSIELSTVDDKGKSTVITSLNKPIEVTLTLSNDEASSIKDALKIGVYCLLQGGGYEFKGGKRVGNKVTFKTAHFSEYAVMQYNKSFDDVTSSLWSKEFIEVLAARHITAGVDKEGKLFAPKSNVTRAQFAAFLVRALGIKTSDYKGEFKDVSADKWYAKEVEAAKDAGLVDGTGTDTFAPDANITREAMAKMIMKAYEIVSATKVSDIASKYDGKLKDMDKVSNWASDYVKAAQALGIINGTTDGSYKPSDKAQRQEIAKVIVTMLEKSGEI